jgi:phosphonoacetaldehyde hydrolase
MIGDTPADIAVARNAGMWTIAVAATGNEIGLSVQEFGTLTDDERNRRLVAARANLLAAGAHFVVDCVAQCEGTLDEIEHRLSHGSRP